MVAALRPAVLPRVVDACSLNYDADSWRAYLTRVSISAPEYLNVFASSFCRYFGTDEGQYRDALRIGAEQAVRLLVRGCADFTPLTRHARQRRDGITAEFVMGSPNLIASDETVNDRLLSLFAGIVTAPVWVGLSLARPVESLSLLGGWLDRGAVGANIIPFLDRVPLSAPANHTLFGAVSDAGLPVWIHTGHHFATGFRQGTDSWREVDDLARHHPRLTIVMGHAGWPQVREALLVAARHPRVFLEFSSHRPKNIAREPEWHALRQAARGPLRHKVMFGTSTWVNPYSTRLLAEEMQELDLPPDVLADWLGTNAAQLVPSVGWTTDQ